MWICIVLPFIAATVIAQPHTVIPRLPKDMPPGFEDVLPTDVVQRLKEVHQNNNLTAEQQHEQIDEIMTSLPAEILDRLPAPPGFERLPLSTREELKQIHRDKNLNWRQRHEKIRTIINALPPPGPPPKLRRFDYPFERSSFQRENKPFYV